MPPAPTATDLRVHVGRAYDGAPYLTIVYEADGRTFTATLARETLAPVVETALAALLDAVLPSAKAQMGF